MSVTKKSTQLRYLREYLDRIIRAQNVYGWNGKDKVKLPKPTAVLAAEKRIIADSKIVEQFRQKSERASEKRKARKQAMVETCRRAVEFDSPEKALALLDRFSKMKF